MGIRVERQRDCDMCHKVGNIKQYKITFVSVPQTLSVDLCPEHGAPLEEIRAAHPGGKRNRPRGQPVVTPAEVKRARKTTKPPPQKKR